MSTPPALLPLPPRCFLSCPLGEKARECSNTVKNKFSFTGEKTLDLSRGNGFLAELPFDGASTAVGKRCFFCGPRPGGARDVVSEALGFRLRLSFNNGHRTCHYIQNRCRGDKHLTGTCKHPWTGDSVIRVFRRQPWRG